MLPFLKPKMKQASGIIMETRKPDSPDEPPDQGLRMAARDLMAAVTAQDEAGVESALRSAFQILDSEEEQPAEPIDESTEG